MEPMENEFQEYATFVVTTRDGSKAELAVVDEFEFENKQYVVGALIEGDVINDDARYIYEADVKDDELVVKKRPGCPGGRYAGSGKRVRRRVLWCADQGRL